MKPQNAPVFLITGASGFVGFWLCSYLSTRYPVTGTYHGNPFYLPGCAASSVDIADRKQVLREAESIRPTHIIHAAALSAPDRCEQNPQKAWDINCGGTAHVLEASDKIGSRMVYVSTDLVFDGMRGDYAEADQTHPLNVYAKTKVAAELLCLKQKKNSSVARITLQYGLNTTGGLSFSDWILERLRNKKNVPLYRDQFRSPAYVADTARGLTLMALKGGAGEIYHLTGPESISRYGFGIKLADIFGLPSALLQPCSMDETRGTAPRPRNVSLCGSKFSDTFGFAPSDVKAGLTRMYNDETVVAAARSAWPSHNP